MKIQDAYLIKNTANRAEMNEEKVEGVLWLGAEREHNGFKPSDNNAPYFHPEMRFWVGHDEDALYVYLRCYEKCPVVTNTVRNGDVCDDSCMEFFITPFQVNAPADGMELPAWSGYFNFETNAHPTLLLYYGLDRDHRDPVSGETYPDAYFNLKSATGADEDGDYWEISYQIPFKFFNEVCGRDKKIGSGSVVYANVYQCGCNDQPSHYTTWKPIDTKKHPRPDFHRPEYFVPMILE